jgi:hypothetical protein
MTLGAFQASLKRLPITSVAGKLTLTSNQDPNIMEEDVMEEEQSTTQDRMRRRRWQLSERYQQQYDSRVVGGKPALDGQLYSFLPMPIHTGLPVHINGMYAPSADQPTSLLAVFG